nr:FecR family protein [Pseudoflavitalea sp. G-6-1-2]
MTLADGSRVWLNAGSSITYPVAFNGESRTVELKGEGYFDVAKDAGKPFKVKTGSVEVEVLGTQFNINAYNDEPIIKTTLVQGSVRVSTGNQQQKLLPGQQAQVNENKQLKLLKQSDMEVELAWKNNEFNFKYLTDLRTVLRQLARWYDLEISYETGAPEHLQFKGAIPMDATLSQVLEALKTTGVHFQQDAKKITILP